MQANLSPAPFLGGASKISCLQKLSHKICKVDAVVFPLPPSVSALPSTVFSVYPNVTSKTAELRKSLTTVFTYHVTSVLLLDVAVVIFLPLESLPVLITLEKAFPAFFRFSHIEESKKGFGLVNLRVELARSVAP